MALAVTISRAYNAGTSWKNDYAFAALKDDGSVVTWGDGSYGGDSSAVSRDLASGVDTVYGSEFHESLSTSVHDYRAPPTTAPTEYPTPMPSPAPTDDSSNSNLLGDLAAGTGLGIGIAVGLAVLGVGVGVYICVNVRAPAKTGKVAPLLSLNASSAGQVVAGEEGAGAMTDEHDHSGGGGGGPTAGWARPAAPVLEVEGSVNASKEATTSTAASRREPALLARDMRGTKNKVAPSPAHDED
jgi:hypothetical protein